VTTMGVTYNNQSLSGGKIKKVSMRTVPIDTF